MTHLGRMSYSDAYALQRAVHAEVLGGRECGGCVARVLTVEHDPPVITKSRRASAAANIVASSSVLAGAGVEVCETDRGGDVTYHGPGQLVVYPIVDLNAFGLRLHPYVRLLERAAIETCGEFGIETVRDSEATGVWTAGVDGELALESEKICAIGIRVSRWVSMHGLALNVAPDLGHFGLIVPCGLSGRGVTSLKKELGEGAPSLDLVRDVLSERLVGLLDGLLCGAQRSESVSDSADSS